MWQDKYFLSIKVFLNEISKGRHWWLWFGKSSFIINCFQIKYGLDRSYGHSRCPRSSRYIHSPSEGVHASHERFRVRPRAFSNIKCGNTTSIAYRTHSPWNFVYKLILYQLYPRQYDFLRKKLLYYFYFYKKYLF